MRNSGKSIVPLPSASTSLIISCSSASVGFWPSDRMTVPNSLVVIVPSPSLSKREKDSLNSAICSSVSWSAWKIKVELSKYHYYLQQGLLHKIFVTNFYYLSGPKFNALCGNYWYLLLYIKNAKQLEEANFCHEQKNLFVFHNIPNIFLYSRRQYLSS